MNQLSVLHSFTSEIETLFIKELLTILLKHTSTHTMISFAIAFPFFESIVQNEFDHKPHFFCDMTENEIMSLHKNKNWCNQLIKMRGDIPTFISRFTSEHNCYREICCNFVKQISCCLHMGNHVSLQQLIKCPLDFEKLYVSICNKDPTDTRERIKTFASFHQEMWEWKEGPEYIYTFGEETIKTPTNCFTAPEMTRWRLEWIFEYLKKVKKTPTERKTLDNMVRKFQELLCINRAMDDQSDIANFFFRYYFNNDTSIENNNKRMKEFCRFPDIIVKNPIVYLVCFLSQTKQLCIDTLDLLRKQIESTETQLLEIVKENQTDDCNINEELAKELIKGQLKTIQQANRMETIYLRSPKQDSIVIFGYGPNSRPNYYFQQLAPANILDELICLLPENPIISNDMITNVIPSKSYASNKNVDTKRITNRILSDRKWRRKDDIPQCKFFKQGNCKYGYTCWYKH